MTDWRDDHGEPAYSLPLIVQTPNGPKDISDWASRQVRFRYWLALCSGQAEWNARTFVSRDVLLTLNSDGASRETTIQGGAAMTTRAEREHLGRVAALSCVVCRNENLGETPAACHHINCGAMGRKASHFEVLPLCKIHHQDGDGTTNYGGQIAVHRGLESFEQRYGTEKELLEQTLTELGYE